MSPNNGGATRPPGSGSAACEEAAFAEDKDVTRCNHDNTNININILDSRAYYIRIVGCLLFQKSYRIYYKNKIDNIYVMTLYGQGYLSIRISDFCFLDALRGVSLLRKIALRGQSGNSQFP